MNRKEVRQALDLIEGRYGTRPDEQKWVNALSGSDATGIHQAVATWCSKPTCDRAPTIADLRGLHLEHAADVERSEQDSNVAQIIQKTRQRLRGDAA